MDQKGVTKNQFLLQASSCIINMLLGVFWLVRGIQEQRTAYWILGLVFIATTLAILIALFIQFRHHPLVYEELDGQIVKNTKGMGLFVGLVALGFLLAFGMVVLLV